MNWLAGKSRSVFTARTSAAPSFRFVCDLRDAIAREVCFTDRYEPQETEIFRRSLRPGMTFLDIGANWGYFTLLSASLVGASGKVIALEPDPRVYRRLAENVRENGFEYVITLPYAAAGEAGIVRFRGYDEAQSNWGTSRIESTAALPTDLAVEARPVDEILADPRVGEIDLMKMDIEGAEGFAMRGLSKTLGARRVRRVILELHPEAIRSHGQTVDEVLEPLRSNGYRGWSIDHSPQSNRRAAYASRLRIESYLRPIAEVRELDSWPHTLWVRDDLELFPPDGVAG